MIVGDKGLIFRQVCINGHRDPVTPEIVCEARAKLRVYFQSISRNGVKFRGIEVLANKSQR